MSWRTIEVKVPDIGGYDDVPVIEVLVAVGDTVEVDQGLVTLESDKATMEVPSSVAGVVRELKVKVGDKLSEGSVVAVLEADAAERCASPATRASAGIGASRQRRLTRATHRPRHPPLRCTAGSEPKREHRKRRRQRPQGRHRMPAASCSAPAPAATPPRSAPPTSAWTPCWSNATPQLGGVCLNVGCIPSKALLHAAAVIDEAAHAADYGIDFGKPKIDARHAARVQGQGRRPADQGPGRHGEAAQGARRHGQRRVRVAERTRGPERQAARSCCASSNASSPPARRR